MRLPGFLERMAPRERALIGFLLLIAVIAALFKLVFTGGEEPITVPEALRTRATPTASPTATPPVFTSEAFEGRDPFQPLVVESTPSTGGGGTNGGGGQTAAQRVKLIDIFTEDGERTATVEVDETQYTVHAGDTFATSYRVLSLTDRCGTFVFGDERFTLCIGQEALK